jgi:hypothetical protein
LAPLCPLSEWTVTTRADGESKIAKTTLIALAAFLHFGAA